MGSISKGAGPSVAKGNRRNRKPTPDIESPPTNGDFTIPVAPLEEAEKEEEEHAPATILSLGKRQVQETLQCTEVTRTHTSSET